MICPKCNIEYKECDINYCSECGSRLIKPKNNPHFQIHNKSQAKLNNKRLDIIIKQNKVLIDILEEINDKL